MKNRRRFLISIGSALGAALALSACATDQPLPGPVAQVGFAHMPPIIFNVARVDVSSEYKSPMQAPNAEQRLPTPPERALFDWALARLQANPGPDVTALGAFVIEDASVIETTLAKSTGFKGLMTYEPAERYDASAIARFTIEDPQTGQRGSIRATAARSIEVRENATLAEREQAWVELVEKLMADFNAQMETQSQTYLDTWFIRR